MAESTALYAWGRRRHGVLGVSTDASDDDVLPSEPLTIGALSAVRVRQVCCGEVHTLALDTDSGVWSWGSGLMGALGHGARRDEPHPRRLERVGNAGGATQITAGTHHSAALCTGGAEVLWWGWDGCDTTACQRSPSALAHLRGAGTRQIAAGSFHLAALTANDGVATHGGGVVHSGVLLAERVVAIAGGTRHTAALSADGAVYTWAHRHTAPGAPSRASGPRSSLLSPAPPPASLPATPRRDTWLDGAAAIVCAGEFTLAVVRAADSVRWSRFAADADTAAATGSCHVAGAERLWAGGGYVVASLASGGAVCVGGGPARGAGAGGFGGLPAGVAPPLLQPGEPVHLPCAVRNNTPVRLIGLGLSDFHAVAVVDSGRGCLPLSPTRLGALSPVACACAPLGSTISYPAKSPAKTPGREIEENFLKEMLSARRPEPDAAHRRAAAPAPSPALSPALSPADRAVAVARASLVCRHAPSPPRATIAAAAPPAIALPSSSAGSPIVGGSSGAPSPAVMAELASLRAQMRALCEAQASTEARIAALGASADGMKAAISTDLRRDLAESIGGHVRAQLEAMQRSLDRALGTASKPAPMPPAPAPPAPTPPAPAPVAVPSPTPSRSPLRSPRSPKLAAIAEEIPRASAPRLSPVTTPQRPPPSPPGTMAAMAAMAAMATEAQEATREAQKAQARAPTSSPPRTKMPATAQQQQQQQQEPTWATPTRCSATRAAMARPRTRDLGAISAPSSKVGVGARAGTAVYDYNGRRMPSRESAAAGACQPRGARVGSAHVSAAPPSPSPPASPGTAPLTSTDSAPAAEVAEILSPELAEAERITAEFVALERLVDAGRHVDKGRHGDSDRHVDAGGAAHCRAPARAQSRTPKTPSVAAPPPRRQQPPQPQPPPPPQQDVWVAMCAPDATEVPVCVRELDCVASARRGGAERAAAPPTPPEGARWAWARSPLDRKAVDAVASRRAVDPASGPKKSPKKPTARDHFHGFAGGADGAGRSEPRAECAYAVVHFDAPDQQPARAGGIDGGGATRVNMLASPEGGVRSGPKALAGGAPRSAQSSAAQRGRPAGGGGGLKKGGGGGGKKDTFTMAARG